ncbi:MAG: pyruvate dehydrogenase complex E1 component subunit beta [Myxococcales bacterium]|nr:pyruvate dehydrogenase complex E1 component subunit beta [Myxococcales bacterium]
MARPRSRYQGRGRPDPGSRRVGDFRRASLRRREPRAQHRCARADHVQGGVCTMRTLRVREAIREAMAEELERDEDVFLMGEEVGQYQGAYKVSEGLLERFGEKRVIDTPIAEAGFAGLGIGAAIVGLRPIIEFMTWNFSAVAFDQLLNNAAKLRQMSGGQLTVPIVFRGPNGSARQVGSQHSHAMEHFYCHVPGLKVVAPATAADAKGLLKSAVRDDNPVIYLESETLYSMKGEVPDGEHLVPIGKGRIAREGKDVTIIAYSRMVHVSLAAAELLLQKGIDCEVIDLRSLRPLDQDIILASVAKTHRAVVAYEGWPYGGVGAEIVDRIQRHAFDSLDAPVLRVTTMDVPMPYNANLEQLVVPQASGIVAAVERVMYRK